MRRLTVLTAVVTTVAFVIGGALWAAHTWSIETVDDPADKVGDRNRVVLDASGYPHISYANQTAADLKYAFFDGSQWVIETADVVGKVASGRPTSIDLDSTGKAHISYCDTSLFYDKLKYARRDGTTTWFTETVDSVGDVGAFNSLAVDSTDQVHIAYSDYGNGYLKYVVGTGGSWGTPEDVDSSGDAGGPCSLALDSLDRPHIAYYYNDGVNAGIKYQFWNGTAWDSRSNISNGAWPSLALDSSDSPHVAYADRDSRELMYVSAAPMGMGWSAPATVDSAANLGAGPDIAVGPDGRPQIVYCRMPQLGSLLGNVAFAGFDGSTWHIEVIDDSEQVWRHVSLAVGAGNQPEVIYNYTGGHDCLRYAGTQGPLAVRWPR